MLLQPNSYNLSSLSYVCLRCLKDSVVMPNFRFPFGIDPAKVMAEDERIKYSQLNIPV